MRKVAVIGAGGRMGRWFTRHFEQSDTLRVSVFDKKRITVRSSGRIDSCETIKACVQGADLVMVCVPLESIVSVVHECLPYMKKGAVLSEISSLKNQIFGVLHAARKDITYLCIHPMFGPATKRSKIIKNLLIPVRSRAKELAILNSIFPRSDVEVISSADLHDEYMAVVIGLTYYLNLVLGSILSKLDLGTVKSVAGTSFGMQVMITESILNDSPELVSSLLLENPYNKACINSFIAESKNIQRLISARDAKATKNCVEDIKTRLNKLTDTDKSYLKFYKAIEYLKALETKKKH